MSVTTIDTRTALIVVDLQKGFLALPTAHPISEVIARAATLTVAFRNEKLPVVLVNVAGAAPGRTEHAPPSIPRADGWSDLVVELNQQPEDHLVTKTCWGAFSNTNLGDYLKSESVTQVVIVGVSTSVGVESTARSAYENGFNVSLAIDAMTDLNLDAHNNSVTRIFPRLGETGTTQEILELLKQRSL